MPSPAAGFKVPSLPSQSGAADAAGLKRKYPGASVEDGAPDDSVEDSRDPAKRPRQGASSTHASSYSYSSSTSAPTKHTFAKPSLPLSRSKALAPSIPLHLSTSSASSTSFASSSTAGPLSANEGEDTITENEDRDIGEETFEADDGDEEGGRFFGGGINETQERILDMFASAPDDPENLSQSLTAPQLRKEITKFERIVRKNYEMRAKYPDDPERYIDSESDLDSAFQFLLPLASDPILYYPIILHSTSTLLPTLMNLLTHENTDIALNVVGVLGELTDDDVGEDVGEDANGEENGGDLIEQEEEEKADKEKRVRMVMGDLIDALLSNNVLDLLVANLIRLDESEESDQDGVFKILTVFENILSFLPPVALQISESTELLPWLLKRVQVKAYDSNKQYASEILSILLQDEREQYIRKDPSGAEELEFMENLFNALCSALTEPEVKRLFLQAEGVELMVYMMREKLLARTRAIKVLDFALQTEDGAPSCTRLVEALGLKTLFAAFMGKGQAKKSKSISASGTTFEDDEHILSTLSSLFTNLSSGSVERTRLLAKFVESGYEKVERLLELRETAQGRCAVVDREIEAEREAMRLNGEEPDPEIEDEFYLRRLNAGLSMLQSADYCLGWVVMEDDGAANHARMMLARRGKSFADVAAVLEEYRDAVTIEEDEEKDAGSSQNGKKTEHDRAGGQAGAGGGGGEEEEVEGAVVGQPEILRNLAAFVRAL